MKNTYFKITIRILVLLSVCFFFNKKITGQTIWLGTISTDWHSGGNWNTGIVPDANDDIDLPAGTPNDPEISGAATAKSIVISSNVTLFVLATGNLSIDGSTGYGIEVIGTLDNSGSIILGANQILGDNALEITGTVNNNTGGLIQTEETDFAGFSVRIGGVLINEGTINTGLNKPARFAGIDNRGNVTNNGLITFDNVGVNDLGLRNHGVIDNSGEMRFGETIAIPRIALFNLNGSSFTNKPTGILNFYDFVLYGLDVTGGTFINEGKIFELSNTGSAIFRMGTSIHTPTFTNEKCGEIYFKRAFSIQSGTFTNNGLLSVEATTFSPNHAATWVNNGIVHYTQPFSNAFNPPMTNNEIMILTTEFTDYCGELSPMFEISLPVSSTLEIYEDAAATVSAGSYDINTNTFTPNSHLPAGTYDFFVKVTDNTGVCPDYVVSWRLVLSYAPTIVTNSANDGAGSFRCAINQANTYPGANTITFNIPGTGSHEILLASRLPSITDDATDIDATSQPGWSLGDIRINGNSAFRGLRFSANDCSVLGIHFDNISGTDVVGIGVSTFAADLLLIDNCAFSNVEGTPIDLYDSDNVTIDNCLVGTDVTGNIDDSGLTNKGVFANQCDNLLVQNTVVSGHNSGAGAAIHLNDCIDAVIENCKIGTDITGTLPIPSDVGIQLSNCTNFLIQSNIISNQLNEGVLVE